MKALHQYVIVAFLFFSGTLIAQEIQYASLLIPKELTENANAVIRLNEKEVIVTSVKELIVQEKRVITVLNKLGRKYVDAFVHYNQDTKVTNLSAVIYDYLGNKVKKYSKRKFTDISAVDGGSLYSDDRVKFLEYTPTSYPYTVVFESEYRNTSTGFIPSWFPIEGHYVSVQKSTYTLINNKGIPFRKKEKNFEGYPITEEAIGDFGFKYKLENQKAIKYERSTIAMRNYLPNVLIALDRFSLKGVYGTATNWKEFGKWMHDSLLLERDQLTSATIAKVKGLVAGVTDPIAKAKIIYNYVQNKTRYISVQVGIGGWEPIAANKVDAVGYGDCKGLTNYTKALLDAVGVTSYYTVVYGGKRRDIDKEFASIQGNHVILNIPNKGEDIWLECTSQTVPFGFLGDFTDDRNVLVITPEGGVIKRTPKYEDEKNLQLIKGEVVLDEKGNIQANVERTSYGTQYNDKYNNEDKTTFELKKYYKEKVWGYVNNLEIETMKMKNNKDSIVFHEKVTLQVDDYATVKDESYLFKVNLFNRINGIPKRYRKRERALKIVSGFLDKDEVVIRLPKAYKMTSLPSAKEFKTPYGYYKVSFEKLDEHTIKYLREYSLKEGVFPKEAYKKYRKFRKTVARYDNLRIELIK